MERFQTRTELIRYAQARASSRACQRAFDNGKVEVLGGFHPLSPSTQPGWLLRVTSKHGRPWLLAITTSTEALGEFGVWEADDVPWENWVGQANREDDEYNLFDGDDPMGNSLRKAMFKHGSVDYSTGSGGTGRVVDRRTPNPSDYLQLGQSELAKD